MNHKPILLKKALNQQELTNWENILLVKELVKNYEIMSADYLMKKFISNPLEGMALVSAENQQWVDNENVLKKLKQVVYYKLIHYISLASLLY